MDDIKKRNVDINNLSDQDKAKLNLAFPDYLRRVTEKMEEEQRKALERDLNPQYETVQYTATNATYDELRHGYNVTMELKPIGGNNHSFNDFFHTKLYTKTKKERKKLPIKKYNIQVINTKLMVGVEGVAQVDPNKIRNKRIGRVPKSKMDKKEITKYKKEHKRKEKKEKQKYDNVLNLF